MLQHPLLLCVPTKWCGLVDAHRSPGQIEELDLRGLSHFPVDQFVQHYTAQMHEFSQLQLEDAKNKIIESQSQLTKVRTLTV